MKRSDLPPNPLPAGDPPASAAAQADHPWPMVLLLGLGGWLAAIPLLSAVGILIGNAHDKPALLILVGAILIAVAVMMLRGLPGRLLIEQSAFPGLLAGGSILYWGLRISLTESLAAAFMAATTSGVAYGVPQRWLKSVLGAIAAILLLLVCNTRNASYGVFWLMLHAEIGLWYLAVSQARGRTPGMDAWCAGWLASVLAGLCVWCAVVAAHAEPLAPWMANTMCALSVTMALAACALMARAFPPLRQPWCMGVALTLLVFTWFMPALGGVLLLLAGCLLQARYRLAVAAGLAAAWVIGFAYYQLSWTLNQKAAVFALAGVIIIALAWRALHTGPGASADTAHSAMADTAPRRARTGLAIAVLSVLIACGAVIWRNETLIANSETVFVELAPADPRSLVQGDYMRLAVRLPQKLQSGEASAMVIGVRDERNIVQLQRMDNRQPLAANELRIALTHKDGRWMLASDAWFFQEGEAKRYANARYGEYRVGKDGRTLLTGLRGPALEKL
jgi:uncharacterized membrane-anchored protein